MCTQNNNISELVKEIDEHSKQVAVLGAGYITKKLSKHSKCSECQLKLMTFEGEIEHDHYL